MNENHLSNDDDEYMNSSEFETDCVSSPICNRYLDINVKCTFNKSLKKRSRKRGSKNNNKGPEFYETYLSYELYLQLGVIHSPAMEQQPQPPPQ
nr:6600_t:CDS:2 [Entrophospora candida]